MSLDYFYARRPHPPSQEECDQGMSDIVSTDVQDAVYAVCAEMLPAFTGDSPVEFEASNEQDEAQADIETRAVNRIANKSGIYDALLGATQDAMLRRAGIIKVYWGERIDVSYQEGSDVPFQALPQLLQQREPDEVIELLQGDVNDEAMTASGTVRRSVKRTKPMIEPVPFDEFLISSEVNKANADEARFVAHQRTLSRSELIELGLDPDLVMELTPYLQSKWRDRRIESSSDWSLRSAHESTDQIMAVEAYYKIDWDGDGIAERRRVVTAGGGRGTDVLLLNEPWNDQPFAIGVGYRGIFTWDGVSLYDRLKMIQDTKTDLIRDLRDTVKRNMRQRIGAVEGDANMDDVLTSVLGGVVRMKTPNGLVPVPNIDVPPAVYQFLDYMDRMRKDKGGGAIDATASAQVLGQGGDWALERLMAATEQLNAFVAKNLIETLVKPVYCKLHKLLRDYNPGPIDIPGTSGWQQTDPQQWGERGDMTISMGMSVGERTARMGALQQVMGMQQQDVQSGAAGILSDQNGIYQARLDFGRLAGLPNPSQYFVDPNSQQAQQAAQQAQQNAQQQQAAQQKQQQEMMQFQYRMMTDVERVRAEAKLQSQQLAEQSKMLQKQLDIAERMFGHQVDLTKIDADIDAEDAKRDVDAMQAQANRQLEREKVTAMRRTAQ